MGDNSLDSAMAFFTLVKNLEHKDMDSTELEAMIRCENGIGVISFINSDYTKAYASFRRALEFDNSPDAGANINLAGLYHYFGDHRRSMNLLVKTFDGAIRSGNIVNSSISLLNIMTSGFTLENPEEISAYRSKMETYLKKVPSDAIDIAPFTRRYTNAMLLASDKKWIAAADTLKTTLALVKKMLIPDRNIVQTHIAIGNCLLQARQADSAIVYFEKAQQLAEKDGFTEMLSTAFGNLSIAYSMKGDKTRAYKYKFRNLELKDSLFNIREFGKLRDFQTAFEVDKFEKEINRLTLEEKIHSRTTAIVSLALAVIAAMLVLAIRQNIMLKRKNRDLFERNVAVLQEQELLRECSIESGNNDITRQNRFTETDAPHGTIKTTNNVTQTKEKYAGSSLSPEMRHKLRRRIEEVMTDEHTICDDGFTIDTLSDIIGSNKHYVSQVLNEDLGKSFSRLLCERRIAIVCRRFMDTDKYGNLTIEAIISDVGFKSRSNFSKTFKNITGLTPTEFIRQARTARSVLDA